MKINKTVFILKVGEIICRLLECYKWTLIIVLNVFYVLNIKMDYHINNLKNFLRKWNTNLLIFKKTLIILINQLIMYGISYIIGTLNIYMNYMN